MLRVEPEKKDVKFNLSLSFLSTYTFILVTIPKSIEIMVERIKPTIASSGK